MSPPRVIVVEDEIMIRLPVVSALEAADFEAIEAGHAGEALAILEREAVRVHVIFTDVHMPGPMDGLVLAHHVRRHWPSIGLLVASGRGNVDAGAMPEGSRFIPKPYHLDHVVHHIRELRALPISAGPFVACPRSADATDRSDRPGRIATELGRAIGQLRQSSAKG
jgi:DNA-binding NtrC family response regulator